MKKIRKAIKKQLSYVREMAEVMLDNSKRKEVESEREILGKMMVALRKEKEQQSHERVLVALLVLMYNGCGCEKCNCFCLKRCWIKERDETVTKTELIDMLPLLLGILWLLSGTNFQLSRSLLKALINIYKIGFATRV